MNPIAAFGIGSTNFRYALGTPDGQFLTDVAVEPTRPSAIDAQIVEAVRSLEREPSSSITAVSVACSGLVDPAEGTVREFDTRTGGIVGDVDLESAIREEFDRPLVLENDCNAAALGEWRFGAGESANCVVHVTFGTGIGAGVVERGRVVRGETGQAAEVGLFPIAPESGLESEGVPGAWEAVCGGRGIPEYVDRRLRSEDRDTALRDADPSAPALFEAAADGDAVAEDYLDRISRYNAAGIGTICNAYNPGCLTIGGGVALNNQRVILEGIRSHVDEFLYVDAPEIRITELGDDVGLYGALANAADAARSEAGGQ